MGVLGLVGLLDIGKYLLKEGSNVELLSAFFRGWLATRYAKLASRYGWLASRINSALLACATRRKSGAQGFLMRLLNAQVIVLITCGQHLCEVRAFQQPFQEPTL